MNTAFCCDANRRDAVREDGRFNGIDWLEVVDREAPVGSPRQRTLLVRCLKPVTGLDRHHVMVAGGDRVRDIQVEWAMAADALTVPPANAAEAAAWGALPEPDHVLVVRVDREGDASPYHLHLVRGGGSMLPPQGFDPLLADVPFSFKVECESPFDCLQETSCPAPVESSPELDYLAKDYASFRRLLLDRMRQLVPGWREQSPADLGVTLVELLAYAGDLYSYRQDAIATEAYLATARSRVSLRRHARLVDYDVDDGANARAWVHLEVAADGASLDPRPDAPNRAWFLTRVDGVRSGALAPGSAALAAVLAEAPETFEPIYADGMMPIPLFVEHNEIRFYTYGERGCTVPAGATTATLHGHRQHLAPGMPLLLEEVKGVRTGLAADADPARRHVVRLTTVERIRDGAPLVDPLTGTPITIVSWHDEDALPFALCLSARLDADHGGQWHGDISVARANLVLCDHGRTRADEPLGTVPAATGSPAASCDPCAAPFTQSLSPRFRPSLVESPVTRVVHVQRRAASGAAERTFLPFDPAASATAAIDPPRGRVIPIVRPASTESGQVFQWQPRPDLLDSDSGDRHFVLESDGETATWLRFGDGVYGRSPSAPSAFTATYRVGNGSAGNIGAEALAYVVTPDARIAAVRNPIAGAGGRDPETAAQIRRRAPQAFRRQERAVTAEDYARLASSYASVERVAATAKWTGSWHTTFVSVDRRAAAPVDAPFSQGLRRHLERYRLAGVDLAIDAPVFVALEIELHICAAPEYFRAGVKQALLRLFSRGLQANGMRGHFHPDNFTFGQPVYLSPILTAAHGVPGVVAASARVFQRLGRPSQVHLNEGRITLGRLEIARLDNDPVFSDRGVLRIDVQGGK